MARGKYGRKAAHQHTLAENQERADNAERRVKDVITELTEYRRETAARIETLEVRLREARAQRDTSTSPKVAELEASNAELAELARTSKAALAKHKKTKGDLFLITVKILRVATGCTGLEATEVAAALELGKNVVLSEAVHHPATVDEAKAIQLAQGYRSNQTIVNKLNELVESVLALR